MKKLFIALAFVLAFSPAYLFAVEESVESIIESEVCTDGIDNDEDTLVDSSDPDCVEEIVEEVEVSTPENTFELCTDGVDNDGNTLVDSSDPDCLSFIPENEEEIEVSLSENTAEFCIDGIDNDEDTLVDSSDPDCLQFIEQEQAPQEQSSGGSGGSGGRSNRGAVAGASIDTGSEGEVLGESIDLTNACTPLTSYMRMGQVNPSDQVMILQSFLNQELGITLPITGFFGPLTDAAVRQFQNKYSADILQPWVEAGLAQEVSATGYVYKTTLHKINVLRCPSLQFTNPVIE